MKHFIFSLSLLLLLFVSCNEDDSLSMDDYKLSSQTLKSIEDGLIEDLNLTSKFGSNVKFENSYLEKIDNNYYLTSIHESGDYVTKTLLVIQGNNLIFGKVSCTSSWCAHNSGCSPNSDGKSCSHCSGDCTKTVSNASYGSEG